MFILTSVLLIASIVCGLIVIMHIIIDGEFPTIFKKSKNAYKQNQNMQVGWSINKSISELPTITLDQFKDFYIINPDSWTLEDYFVFKDNNKRLSFTFTYEEWKKYNAFRKQMIKEINKQKKIKEQQRITKEQNETTRKILESVQKDINKIYAEHNENMKNAERLINEARK